MGASLLATRTGRRHGSEISGVSPRPHRKLARRVTYSFPAQRLGLTRRGLLRDGFKADIVVFDPVTVKAPATRQNPKQCAVGIDHVVVDATVVVAEGRHTGACPAASCVEGTRIPDSEFQGTKTAHMRVNEPKAEIHRLFSKQS